MGFFNSLAYDMMDNDKLHYKENVVLTHQTKWLVALSSILSSFNGDYVNALETGKSDGHLTDSLPNIWGIADRDSFIEQATWLTQEGQRSKYQPNLELVKLLNESTFEKPLPIIGKLFYTMNMDELLFTFTNIKLFFTQKPKLDQLSDALGLKRKTNKINMLLPIYQEWLATIRRKKLGNVSAIDSLLAWDAVRLVNICRWSLQLGYIREIEFVEYANQLTVDVKKTYQSWDEVIVAYAIAGFIWNSDEGRVKNMVRTLNMLKKDPQSLINQVPFK